MSDTWNSLIVERANLQAEVQCLTEKLAEVEAERDQLKNQLTRYRAALGFYADSKNWENNTVDIGVGNLEEPQSSEIYQDQGHIAMEALILK